MATLYDLSVKMERLVTAVERVGSEHAKETALAIVKDLAYNTPVDTGLHVSNWRVGIGSPARGVIEAHVPGQSGDTAAANANATVGAARAALRAKRPGQTIFISNEAPAIVHLNNGSSRRAPAGFVERALLIGRKIARKVRLNG